MSDSEGSEDWVDVQRALNEDFITGLRDILESQFYQDLDAEGRPTENFPALEIVDYLYNDEEAVYDRLAGLSFYNGQGYFRNNLALQFPDLVEFLERWNLNEIEDRLREEDEEDQRVRANQARVETVASTRVEGGSPAQQVRQLPPRSNFQGAGRMLYDYDPDEEMPDLTPVAGETEEELAQRRSQQQQQHERELQARMSNSGRREDDDPPIPGPDVDPLVPDSPTREPVAAPAPPPVQDMGVRSNLAADREDCQNAHYWKGQRLPPVGIRLRHILNFLSDEDVNRDPIWEDHVEELREYLHFLLSDDEFSSLGDGTKRLIREAIRRIAAHDIFDKWHGPQDQVFVPNVEDVPVPQQRLKPIPGFPLVTLGSKVDELKLPRLTQSRSRNHRLETTNAMSHYSDAAGYLDALRRAEEEYWETEPGVSAPDNNLYQIEQSEYEACLKARKGFTFINEGRVCLSRTRNPVDTTSAADFAAEHGSRRAGLQQTLSLFNNAETAAYCTRWRKVQLPVPAKTLAAATRSASGMQYKTEGLDKDRLDRIKELEPQPYTVAMANYKARRDYYLNQARISVEERNKDNQKWPRLPEFYGVVPFPLFPAEVTDKFDLFREMSAVDGLLQRAHKIYPRPLLREISEFITQGQGAAITVEKPKESSSLVLRKDFDWEIFDEKAKDITPEEVAWLKFLVHPGSVNDKLAEDLPHENATLFLTFAERLQAIFDDLDGEALFPEADTLVRIEDVLKVMNNNWDRMSKNPGKIEPMFAVWDALAFCERLSEWGRCRFHEDEEHYAYVQRPIYDIHPEHLISHEPKINDSVSFIGRVQGLAQFQPAVYADDKIGAPRRTIDVGTWMDVVRTQRNELPLPMEIRHFFRCLAFRFGFTARRHNTQILANFGGIQPLSERRLARAMIEWDREYQDIINAVGGKGLSLRDVVERADPARFKEEGADLTEEKAKKTVAEKLITEAQQDLNPLHPTRIEQFTNKAGQLVTVRRREKIWDWAKPSIRGKAPSFFNMNRWPPKLLTPERQKRVESGVDRDPAQLWDPLDEDSTPVTWYRRKARMYEDKRVTYRKGPQTYTIGDTRLQRELVQGMATYALLTEWGWNPDKDPVLKAQAGTAPDDDKPDGPPPGPVYRRGGGYGPDKTDFGIPPPPGRLDRPKPGDPNYANYANLPRSKSYPEERETEPRKKKTHFPERPPAPGSKRAAPGPPTGSPSKKARAAQDANRKKREEAAAARARATAEEVREDEEEELLTEAQRDERRQKIREEFEARQKKEKDERQKRADAAAARAKKARAEMRKLMGVLEESSDEEQGLGDDDIDMGAGLFDD